MQENQPCFRKVTSKPLAIFYRFSVVCWPFVKQLLVKCWPTVCQHLAKSQRDTGPNEALQLVFQYTIPSDKIRK